MTMTMIAMLAFIAFMFCMALTPVCRDLFIKRGLVDQPDTLRKLHTVAVPRCGGIGVVASYFAALAVAYAFVPSGGTIYVQHHALFQAVLPATILIFLVGLADDLLDLRPRHKLLGQTIAALLAVSLGARLTLHHGPAWVGFLASVMWLLACTNAVNLIDGMDGLATGVGLTATFTTLITALLTGNLGLAIATAPLAGALLAFLRYNFAPASVFLGDSGSLTIGFLLGCLGLVWSGHLGGWGMLGPLFALALPLMDVSLSIGRRFLRRVPIFQGDRGHIHHRVQDLGLSTRHAALVLYACCVLFATFAVLQNLFSRWLGISVVLVFVAFMVVGVRRLQYVEFRAARRTLSHRVFRRVVQQEIQLEEMRRALALAKSPDDYWLVVRRACDEMHVATLQLQLDGKRFVAHQLSLNPAPACTVHIPLGEENWIVLTGPVSISAGAITTALQPLFAALENRVTQPNQKDSLRTAA